MFWKSCNWNWETGNKPDKKEGQVQKKDKGTWQEWIEGNKDTSEFFTMDYSHVKRRRPIHNKSVPISKNGPWNMERDQDQANIIFLRL